MGIEFFPEYELPRQVVELVREAHDWAKSYAIRVNHYEVDPDDLNGACAVASGYLFSQLKRAGYRAHIVLNEMHAFLIINHDGQEVILDPTASQFNFIGGDMAFLYVTTVEDCDYRHENWRIDQVFDNLSDMVDYQIRVGWPALQVAKKRYRKVKKG